MSFSPRHCTHSATSARRTRMIRKFGCNHAGRWVNMPNAADMLIASASGARLQTKTKVTLACPARRYTLDGMGNLDNQNAQDSRREDRARLRLKLFGPSRADVWKALAEEIGGTFSRAGFLNYKDRVDVNV